MKLTLLLLMLLSLHISESHREMNHFSPRSCKELMEKYKTTEDGLYFLSTPSGAVYHTYCDMKTAGGGWTLVASVHENNMYGKCTTGDRWSSQQGSDVNVPGGDGSWSNTVTFGSAEAATSDDYKNPGYYDLDAKDVAIWHVPNDKRVESWNETTFLRYRTDTNFLSQYGGNLYHLFKRFPVMYNVGSCPANNGPTIPIVYDVGNAESNHNMFGPDTRANTKPGFIMFRAINYEKAAMAICVGVKPTDCNTEHSCIGGGGHFPEVSPRQCGDFTGFDWNGYGSHVHWSASKQMIEAAVLIFYR